MRESARGLIKAAVETGPDVAGIAKAAVEEAVESTKAPDVQVDTKEVTSAVVAGLRDGAAEIGDYAVKQAVSDILAGLEIEEEPA
ncbi:hypothetical protein ACFLUK_00155 [Chloroflexota bacterium]